MTGRTVHWEVVRMGGWFLCWLVIRLIGLVVGGSVDWVCGLVGLVDRPSGLIDWFGNRLVG